MNHAKLGDLNAEIERLRLERSKLLNEMEFGKKLEITNLEWTADCVGRFRINALNGELEILVYGKVPYSSAVIEIMRDGTEYLSFTRSSLNEEQCFSTSSEKLLYRFLETVKFKDFLYDERSLRLLEAARRYKEGLGRS